MNSTPRTATRGGNKSKSDSAKGHKSDNKRDGPKNNDASKAQSSSERITHITESVTDENSIKKRISTIMGVIQKSEDEILTALHDCDNDVNKAVTMLLEGEAQGEWETSGKKKKNRQTGAAKGGDGTGGSSQQEGEDADTQPLAANQDRERSRGRGGGSSRMRGRGGADNRGPGRGRDNNKENEGAGGEDCFRGGRGDGMRRGGRGMSNGPGGRGGRGGRGGGGRLGSRTFQGRDSRDGREKSDGDRFPSTIDTWNPTGPQDSNEKPLKMDNWVDGFPAAEDWDNEEYTGSLADTKVFTPSALETSVVAPEQLEDTSNQDLISMQTSPSQDFRQSGALPSSSLPVGVGTLSTAQAQYLSQLTQQSAENMKASAAASGYGQAESLKAAVGIGSSASYAQSATYGQSGSYGQANYAPTATYGGTTTSYPPSSGYAATSAAGNAYSAATSAQGNTYSSGSTAFPVAGQGYQTSNNSSFGVYPSSGGSYSTQSYSSSTVPYDGTGVSADSIAPTAQPTRAKTQRPRVPPPSKIPSSAVEMPEDSISSSVSSLDVQFGNVDIMSDGTTFELGGEQNNKFAQPPPTSSVSSAAASDVTSAGAPVTNLDTTSSQHASLNAFSAAKSASAANSQQSTLVGGLTGKGLSSSEALSIQSSGDHKSNYASQPSRTVSTASGLDLSKTDVGSLSYASAPSAANYTTYQNQKNSSSSVYQPATYSAGSYTAAQTTYANAVPSSYSTTAYNSQQSVNNSFPNSSYSAQPPNTTNYATNSGAYPSANSFQNASQNYQSGTASVYGMYSAASGYQNSYSASSAASSKLNSGLSTAKDSQEYTSSATSNISSTATTTSSLLTSASTPQAATTTSSKISTGAMKSGVVPSLHPQMMGPQYIMSGASMPFYHQPPMYGLEDVQFQLQRIPHMPGGYYDIGAYSAPTSLATGRDPLPNVAYTTTPLTDGRYSARGDNNASPVPSTHSQTATAHQQPIMNHPSFPPGYTYVYNPVPGSFQYGAPIFPVPSAGNAHGASSNQYAKPPSYGSSYGSNYDGLSQTADYSKSPYVSGGVKSGVGATSAVSSATTPSDLYGKAHTALGKVNSYDKQGFHSATPPPFNLAAGQGTGMAASGAYPMYMTMPPQQHPNTQLIPSHLQDTSNSSGQRSQSAAQPSKSGNKQNYNAYWAQN